MARTTGVHGSDRRPPAPSHAPHRVLQREGRHLQDHAVRERGGAAGGPGQPGPGGGPGYPGARRQVAGRGRPRPRPHVHHWLLDPVRAPFEAVVRPRRWPASTCSRPTRTWPASRWRWPPPPDRADRLDQRLAPCRRSATTWCCSTLRRRSRLVTDNVLRAARELVVPVALTYLALDGCAEVLDSLARLRAERGRAPALTLVVPTLHRRTQLADEILRKLQGALPVEQLSPTVLGWSVKVDEAQSHGQDHLRVRPRVRRRASAGRDRRRAAGAGSAAAPRGG